jgi:drug/metabolite transporter (DMT)-like permease
LVVATATIWLVATVRGNRPAIPRADLPRFALYGLFAALHFLCYVSSLSYTTVAHSLTLVYTSPLMLAFLSAIFLSEPLARRKLGGVVVTVVGLGILAGFESAFDRRMLWGDLLALGGALSFALYSIAGRSEREHYPLLTYTFGVYGMGALWLTPAAFLSHTPAWGEQQLLSVVALGVFPLAVGHTLYNGALRRTHATYASLVATQEITLGVLLGALLLGEVPGPSTMLGVSIALGGIIMVLV